MIRRIMETNRENKVKCLMDDVVRHVTYVKGEVFSEELDLDRTIYELQMMQSRASKLKAELDKEREESRRDH